MTGTGTHNTALAALVAVIAGVEAATAAYQQEIQQARERILSGSQVAHTSCGPIEYAVAGDGPPVLVVQGAGGRFDQGMEPAAPLVERGFRVIAISRSGYLRTPLPGDGSSEAQADVHACLMNRLGVAACRIHRRFCRRPSSLQFSLRHQERISALVLLIPAAHMPRQRNAQAVRTPSGTQFLLDTALRSDLMSTFARETACRAILATPIAAVRNAAADEQARVRQILDHLQPISLRRQGLLNEASVIPGIRAIRLNRSPSRP